MGSTDATASQIQLLRQALLVNYAVNTQLDAVGNNHNVPRPEDSDDDELYRRIVKALAWLPKQILLSYYSLLTAVFGTQEAVTSAVGRPWKVYEVNPNEVIIEIPVEIISGNIEISAYLHGASGYARVASGPSNTFTTDFDLSLSSAVTIVGLNIYVETAPGTWTTYTVSNYAFVSGVATVTVSASTLPTGGGHFYLEVPGDLVDSYRGKYLATGGFEGSYSTAAGPATNTLNVVGDATKDVQPGMTVVVSVNSAFQTRVVAALSYSSTTNVTAVTITTTDVPGGQVGQVFMVSQEVADTATTPPHSDRIYLTGTGLYQVVQFYLDLLVRAAGIVVRLEII
jgi:hypothetical protein